MAYEEIRYGAGDGGIATIALDDPDTRNALSNDLLGELTDAFEQAGSDESVRCIVLTSTHAKVFSSGGNVAQFAADTPLIHRHFATERFVRLFGVIGGPRQPTARAADGPRAARAPGLGPAPGRGGGAGRAGGGPPPVHPCPVPFT